MFWNKYQKNKKAVARCERHNLTQFNYITFERMIEMNKVSSDYATYIEPKEPAGPTISEKIKELNIQLYQLCNGLLSIEQRLIGMESEPLNEPDKEPSPIIDPVDHQLDKALDIVDEARKIFNHIDEKV